MPERVYALGLTERVALRRFQGLGCGMGRRVYWGCEFRFWGVGFIKRYLVVSLRCARCEHSCGLHHSMPRLEQSPGYNMRTIHTENWEWLGGSI